MYFQVILKDLLHQIDLTSTFSAGITLLQCICSVCSTVAVD